MTPFLLLFCRRTQLRELALLNGTLREGEGPRCTNCGAADHKAWQCQDKANITNSIVCSACGNAGHIARDCQQRRPGTGFGPGGEHNKTKMDDEVRIQEQLYMPDRSISAPT